MNLNLIGHITLNLSTAVYIVWLVPQILLNFKRKNTEGLSMLMHGILCVGYLSDLMYGFGLGMQWQYRAVTLVGLGSLAIQHYQFGHYGLHRTTEKRTYLLLNILYLVLFSYTIYAIAIRHQNRNFYDAAGLLSNVCWLTYLLPQIIKNYINKSTVGLSSYFVGISIFLTLCDSTSAWTLAWDYPSKIGPVIALTGHLILLTQILRYAKRNKEFTTRLAFNR